MTTWRHQKWVIITFNQFSRKQLKKKKMLQITTDIGNVIDFRLQERRQWTRKSFSNGFHDDYSVLRTLWFLDNRCSTIKWEWLKDKSSFLPLKRLSRCSGMCRRHFRQQDKQSAVQWATQQSFSKPQVIWTIWCHFDGRYEPYDHQFALNFRAAALFVAVFLICSTIPRNNRVKWEQTRRETMN